MVARSGGPRSPEHELTARPPPPLEHSLRTLKKSVAARKLYCDRRARRLGLGTTKPSGTVVAASIKFIDQDAETMSSEDETVDKHAPGVQI